MGKRQAISYYRTSSAANVGTDKDSQRRQKEAVETYAKALKWEIVDSFYDAAVSGADPIESRAGFAAMLDRIEGNGVRTIIVEDASRFARSVIAQELGVLLLQKRGVTVLTSNGDNLTETDDPAKVLMRQVAGAFAQYEKTRLVAKLKGARDRKRAATGRCEGRKPVPDAVVSLAKQLARKNPKTGERRSLRDIAAELAAAGHTVPNKDGEASGNQYLPGSVKLMLARPVPKAA
jgi:DNA invertase Pin-like site-specific DNA recombinase